MSHTDLMHSTPTIDPAAGRCGDIALPVNPFVSNRYHFGMLLGVADLEAEQAYHRGKMWLHNAWLHGTGVVWGLDVVIEADRNEVVVQPGLAIDAHGRELYVRDAMCLDLGAWFAERRPSDLEVTDVQGDHVFEVAVELCHDSCLDRPVPSISDPCEDASFDTAYSRAVERGLPRLLVPPADPVEQYPRLRQYFGQVAVTDPDVVQARAEVEAAAPGDRAATCLAWFRRLAAADVTDLAPETDAAGWSPFAGDGCVLLATIRARLHPVGDRFEIVDADTTVDTGVRPAHVRTRTIQELLCHGHGAAPDGGGTGDGTGDDGTGDGTGDGDTGRTTRLQAVAGSAVADDTTVRITFTTALADAAVHRDAFEVSILGDDGWDIAPIDRAVLEDPITVRLDVNSAIDARPLRVVARGTGPAPLLAAAGAVLTGVVGDPLVPSGSDAALMITDAEAPEEG